MVNKGLLTKEVSGVTVTSKGEKRKINGQTTAEEIKPLELKAVKANKAPLKAELIVRLKTLEKEYEALAEENKALKSEKVKHIQTIDELQKKVTEIEEKAEKNTTVELVENEAEDLDLSFGPRYCKKCDHEAEDGYQLDAHLWSEHEEDEEGAIFCKFCNEKFANIPNMMIHKKIKHKEKINYCQNFNSNGCPYEDRKCWFLHTKTSEAFKCNICDQTFLEKSQFMKHRKSEHPEMVKTCKNNECIYKNECWFIHEQENTKVNNIKTNENEKLIEKLVGLVEKLNERVSSLENPENEK